MNNKVKKICIAGILCAITVAGSTLSFPVLGSKCAPVQHIVNILSAVILGPYYGVLIAFISSTLRNILGLGSLMAYPGSMFGALLCGVAYKLTKNIPITLGAEVFGTSVLGGLFAYPVAVFIMGVDNADIAFYSYIIPFFISTFAGAVISAFIIATLKKANLLHKLAD